MGKKLNLTSSDGFTISAYMAEPSGTPRGAMIVVQEIFGVNHHIQGVADSFAAEGYLSIAPAFFDRVQPGIDLGYTPKDIETARAFMAKVDMEKTVLDVNSALAQIKHAGKVGIVGYCWGGRVAWVSNARVDGLACSVSYYGGGIPGLADLKPKVPAMFHWGELDQAIPLPTVHEFIARHPEAKDLSFIYPGAQHGFHCDERGSYNPEAAKIARQRTMEFLHKHVG